MFHCRECHHEASSRLGRCPNCGKWSSMAKGPAPAEEARGYKITAYTPISGAIPATAVETEDTPRIKTGIDEVDRVTGGGFVEGGGYLFTGAPGAGKSTLATQIAASVVSSRSKAFYVCGEESPGRVADRVSRVAVAADRFLLWKDKEIEGIITAIREEKPRIVVIDSIQAVYSPTLDSSAGSTSQMMYCNQLLHDMAQKTGIPYILIGHVTKDKNAAGPRKLEHDVDAFLHFDGDRDGGFRFLRAFKNRFGSTAEVGIFRMTSEGLVAVDEAAGIFYRNRSKPIRGAALAVVPHGRRMLLAEVQCLAVDREDKESPPRRSISGMDKKRVEKIIAALREYIDVKLSSYDLFLSTLGGLEITDPGADLAIATAVVSAIRGIPTSDVAAIGEISLTGEVCTVEDVDARAEFSNGKRRRLIAAGRQDFEETENLDVMFQAIFGC